MGAFYPAGDEQVIVYEVTGRVVPEGGIPLNVGVVVSNVETALNVLAAVRHQAPVIEKYVTLTGAVRTPKTVKVPLGITVAEALALAGGPTVEHYEVINGRKRYYQDHKGTHRSPGGPFPPPEPEPARAADAPGCPGGLYAVLPVLRGLPTGPAGAPHPAA